jgi:hypothetical protein
LDRGGFFTALMEHNCFNRLFHHGFFECDMIFSGAVRWSLGGSRWD